MSGEVHLLDKIVKLLLKEMMHGAIYLVIVTAAMPSERSAPVETGTTCLAVRRG